VQCKPTNSPVSSSSGSSSRCTAAAQPFADTKQHGASLHSLYVLGVQHALHLRKLPGFLGFPHCAATERGSVELVFSAGS
jgi:hypothetical protein